MKKLLRTLAIGLVASIAVIQIAHAGQAGQQGAEEFPHMLLERHSPLGFDETLARIEANAKELGWKVPKKWKVDFRGNMKRATGKDIGPNRVLKMCEPNAAVELLLKDEYKMLTAMMPCTIAVYEKSDGKTYVSMMNLELMGMMYGGDVATMALKLAPQMDQMLTFD
jgi:uncharacterized protein (DUF302 family)